MEPIELKEYIFEHDKTHDILEAIGCHGFTSNTKEIRCARPGHTNKSAVVIKNTETLN